MVPRRAAQQRQPRAGLLPVPSRKRTGKNQPPTNWRSMIGPRGWHRDGDSGDYYFASFLPFQPDLNHRNPAVQRAMFDIIERFVRLGVDGLRLDIFNALYKDDRFWTIRRRCAFAKRRQCRRFFQRNLYTINHPDSIAFARTFRSFVSIHCQAGPRFLVGKCLVHRAFCDPTADSMPTDSIWFLFKTLRTEFSAAAFTRSSKNTNATLPIRSCRRGCSEITIGALHRTGWRRSTQPKVLATLQLTARGVPFVYQGDEIGMTNLDLPIATALDPLAHFYRFVPPWLQRLLRRKGVLINRDECRTRCSGRRRQRWFFAAGSVRGCRCIQSYPWTNVARPASRSGSLLAHYRRLFHAATETPALHAGRLVLWHPTNLPRGCSGIGANMATIGWMCCSIFMDARREVSIPQSAPCSVSTHPDAPQTRDRRCRLRPFESVILRREAQEGAMKANAKPAFILQ